MTERGNKAKTPEEFVLLSLFLSPLPAISRLNVLLRGVRMYAALQFLTGGTLHFFIYIELSLARLAVPSAFLVPLCRSNKRRFIRVHGMVCHHIGMQPDSAELGRARFSHPYYTAASALAVLAVALPSSVFRIPPFQPVYLKPDSAYVHQSPS